MRGDLFVRDAEVDRLGRVDVGIRAGLIVEVGPDLAPAGRPQLEGRGGGLLPGLHDHHLHLLALAASFGSVACGPPLVTDAEGLASALRGAASRRHPGTWLRGTGYHEGVAGLLGRTQLDGITADHPVRIQHRSGRLWVLNSAALHSTGLHWLAHPAIERDGHGAATGRIWLGDQLLRDRIPTVAPDLSEVGRRLAALGVTGVTDATPGLDAGAARLIVSAAQTGALPQRLALLGPDDLDDLDPTPAGRVRLGPLKIVLDEAAGLDLAAAVEVIRRSHVRGRPVAIHCVTRAEVVVSVRAIAIAGGRRGDRLEHASTLPTELDDEVRGLGLTVVTNPGFVGERGEDYARDVAPEDQSLIYRCGTLLRSGIPVGAGTDAPFGHHDPWRAMRSAVDRCGLAGTPVAAHEAVEPVVAAGLFLADLERPGGPSRRIEVGAPGDLCLLDRPIAQALEALDGGAVRATVIDGSVVAGG